MKEMVMKFYTGNETTEIDLVNPPENLEEQIKKGFGEYTRDTNPLYVDGDKLRFVDLIRSRLYDEDFDDFYHDYAHNMVDAACDGDIDDFDLDEDVRSSIDFAQACYERGNKRLDYRVDINRDQLAMIHTTLVRMITAVMSYQPPKETK